MRPFGVQHLDLRRGRAGSGDRGASSSCSCAWTRYFTWNMPKPAIATRASQSRVPMRIMPRPPAMGPQAGRRGALGAAQPGGAGARIGGDLGLAGDGLVAGAARKLGARARPGSGRWRDACGVRPVRARRNRLTRRSSSEWKETTASRPPGVSSASARGEAAVELAQLVVHRDAQRLEGAGRRIDGVALLAADDAAHDRGELAGARDRRLARGGGRWRGRSRAGARSSP